MGTSIFLPQKINIGYQERSGTYTGRLAYVIYFDEKGKLRKEASWSSWRHEKLGNDIYENAPMSGFVLNKKAGGYSTGWNHRQTYVRVYDPRGFEFEITVPNLLYILENATSTKGKGLEGEFVYGWDGTDLLLVPTDSPDYKELAKINELRHAQNFVKARDLKIGATYLSKDNVEHIYVGKFDEYDWYGKKKDKKSFYFHTRSGDYFTTMSSISQKFVLTVSEDCVEDYASIFEKLEQNTTYSPIDRDAYEYIPYTLEEFLESITKNIWLNCYNMRKHEIEVRKRYNGQGYYSDTSNRDDWDKLGKRAQTKYSSLEEIFNEENPMWRKVYLANGKFYKEER